MERKPGENEDMGHHTVPIGQQPTLILQDFLRSIPRKLLSSDLFEEWMGALEMQDEEDRIEALKQ